MATDGDSLTAKPFSVLFVCFGSIYRSPAAEGVFKHLVNQNNLDSKFYSFLLRFRRRRFDRLLPRPQFPRLRNPISLVCRRQNGVVSRRDGGRLWAGFWAMGLVVGVGSWVALVELIGGIPTAEGVGIGGGAEEEFGLRKDRKQE
ncbi:hypothetical protein ACP275_04G177200 [Erythranthe tilingii]